jgi:hypothetical protein
VSGEAAEAAKRAFVASFGRRGTSFTPTAEERAYLDRRSTGAVCARGFISHRFFASKGACLQARGLARVGREEAKAAVARRKFEETSAAAIARVTCSLNPSTIAFFL